MTITECKPVIYQPDWDISAVNRFPILDRQRIVSLTRIVGCGDIERLTESQGIEIDSRQTPKILVTGMPHLGKTTTIHAVSEGLNGLYIPHKIVTEGHVTYSKDFEDEWGSFLYNMAMANYGLAELAGGFHDSPLTLFDRGLVDHIVFARALEKLYEKEFGENSYAEYIDIFSNYLSMYLPLVHGIVVCNSSAETSIDKGCKFPKDLLKFVSQGFANFPETLSGMLAAEEELRATINIDFDSDDNPHDILERAIYTLIKWNAFGKIEA